MKKIHIFKTGTHTSAAGTTHEFSESLLQDAVNAYDPALHEAPIVIGHPKGEEQAYGWIESMSYSDGDVEAIPHQVSVEFEEAVKAGKFKKVSASWYTPDHPQNPAPGNLYLRHVGFLGAQPPAIKGLRPVEFSEGEGETIEFEESISDAIAMEGTAGVFKRLREFLIDKFSREEADRVIPDYVIEDVKSAANSKFESTTKPINYSEGDDTMTLEELQAENETLKAQLDDANSRVQSLEGQVNDFNESQKAARKAHIETQVDALVAEGLLPASQRDHAISFAEQADAAAQTMEFGEGDDKTELKGADAYIKFMRDTAKPSVDFSERAKDENEAQKPLTAQELTAKALSFQESEAKEGRDITLIQAINHIHNQQAEK